MRDTFSRTVSPGWATPEIGGQWFLNLVAGTTATNASSLASVSGGRGRGNVSASGSSRYFTAVSGSVNASDYDVLATLNSGPTGSLIGVLGRASGTGVYLAWMISGQNTIKLTTGAVVGPLGTGTLASAVQPNTDYLMRFQLQGTSLRARAWQAGSAEPTSWQVTATDGHVLKGLAGVMAGFPNTGLTTFSFDDISATPLAAGGGAAALAMSLNLGTGEEPRAATTATSPNGNGPQDRPDPDPPDLPISLTTLSDALGKQHGGEPPGGRPTVVPCAKGCPLNNANSPVLGVSVPDPGVWLDGLLETAARFLAFVGMTHA